MKKQNILELVDNYDLFALDLYGVIWKGNTFFPDALERMSELRKLGKKVVLLSNYPCLSETVENIWKQRGMLKGVHYDELITSGQEFHDSIKLVKSSVRYWVVGWHPLDVFQNTAYEQVCNAEKADFIFTGEPMLQENGVWKEQSSIDYYKPVLERLLMLEKPMVCINPDKISHSNDTGDVAVRAGALAEYFQKIGGKVDFYGKPYKSFLHYALRERSYQYTLPCLLIGDTLETDILGGHNIGIDTALTLCGMSVKDMKNDGFADIETYARKKGILPTYYIDEL